MKMEFVMNLSAHVDHINGGSEIQPAIQVANGGLHLLKTPENKLVVARMAEIMKT